jgi:predicted nucleic acid-binding protein
MPETFVDTNVLLYAVSNAPAERLKSAEARRIVRNEDIALSAQVLQEFYWVSTRPNKLALTHDEADGQDYDGVTVVNPFRKT